MAPAIDSFDFNGDLRRLNGLFLGAEDGELYRRLLSIVERRIIENALCRTEGNKLKAARILGINRNTLHAKVVKLKIDVRPFKSHKRRCRYEFR